MNRCDAGGIAWSWVATRYQDGIVFQAGSSETESNASYENGHCSTHIWSAWRLGTSPAKAVSTPLFVR